MSLLRRCVRELWRLFVDDGLVAVLIVGWTCVACLVLGRLPAGGTAAHWSGPLLFAGFALIVATATR